MEYTRYNSLNLDSLTICGTNLAATVEKCPPPRGEGAVHEMGGWL
jgi:hypothetical protein